MVEDCGFTKRGGVATNGGKPQRRDIRRRKFWFYFTFCVNAKNGIKYRMVIGRESRGSAYRP